METILHSSAASLLILAVQAAVVWAFWSLRRAFVRQEEFQEQLQRQSRYENAFSRRILTLEQQVRQTPGESRLNQLHSELAGLRGDIMALNARITGLDQLLSRLERSLERQEERLRPLPARQAGEAL